jgi:hypothetical protein
MDDVDLTADFSAGLGTSVGGKMAIEVIGGLCDLAAQLDAQIEFEKILGAACSYPLAKFADNTSYLTCSLACSKYFLRHPETMVSRIRLTPSGSNKI